MTEIRIVEGGGICSVQVWTESLKGRPFPASAVLVDIKSDGTLLHNPKNPELVKLRQEILSQLS